MVVFGSVILYGAVMKLQKAAQQLESIGNVTRLNIFKVLVEAGVNGVPVGEIQKSLDIPASTLSHHIAKLVQAGMIKQVRESRTLYCQADYTAMKELVEFLGENCCGKGACC